VLQFSVQADYLHLVVEARDRSALSRGMQGLAIRLARAVNRRLGRRGSVWSSRYHARALATPREVRNGLIYVLQNWRKHRRGAVGLDPCSSALWFPGFVEGTVPAPGPSPVLLPQTWLAAAGWKRLGLLRVGEGPAWTRRRPVTPRP
jgi:hypothetical protein